MRVVSLFSGAGGFDLGFEQAGAEIVYQCEIDPQARSVLKRHWPSVECHDDVRTLTDLPECDVIIGGTPCQDLSIAGTRSGLDGERSGLWWEYLRLVEKCRPRFAVWENVSGAFSSNRGRDFGVILNSLAKIGAVDIAYRICDAQHWGVPQRRKRIFLVADFAGECAAEILALSDSGKVVSEASRSTRKEDSRTLASGIGNDRVVGAIDTRPGRFHMDGTDPLVIGTLAGHHYRNSADDISTVVVAPFDKAQITSGTNRSTVRTGSESPTLNASGQMSVVQYVAMRGRDGGNQAELGGEVMTSLRTAGGGSSYATVMTDLGVRRLTPLECERLMGWPDDHTRYGHDGKEMSDSARYRMIGNGVVASVAKWIAERMKAAL